MSPLSGWLFSIRLYDVTGRMSVTRTWKAGSVGATGPKNATVRISDGPNNMKKKLKVRVFDYYE